MRSFVCLCVMVVLLVSPRFSAAAASATRPSEAVIAVFILRGPLNESPGDESFPLFGPQEQSLKDVVAHMKKAAGDDNVKAVVVMADNSFAGFGQTEELRQ